MLNQSLTIATRILQQQIRDRRTIAIIVVVPVVTMSLIGLSFPEDSVLDFVAPAILTTLSFFFGFLLTGISFLRERSQGTMERLMASPISRLDIVVGYLFGFFIFALTQALILLVFTVYFLDVNYLGELWQIILFQVVVIIGAVNMGIFLSGFARNEFQMAQFIPLTIAPQMFLSGVIWPIEQMPYYLQWLSVILPLTYAVDGLRSIMLVGQSLLDVVPELSVLAGFALIMSILAANTLKRSPAG